MKNICLFLLCIFITSCGTFNVRVEILPDATPTSAAGLSATNTPGPQQTSTLLASQITFTSTPTRSLQFLPTLETNQPIVLAGIYMQDTLHGWAVEQLGHILKTEDGGLTWHDRTPPAGSFDAHHFFAYNSEAAWAIIAQSESSPLIWRTQDGGQTWRASEPIQFSSTDKPQVLRMQFPDARHGWVLFQTRTSLTSLIELFRSNDGGETWQAVTNLADADLQSYLPDTNTPMLFFNGQNGLLGGWWSRDDPNRWAALKTNDGGENWKVEQLPAMGIPVSSLPLSCSGRSISSMPSDSIAVEVSCTSGSSDYHTTYYLSTFSGEYWRTWDLPAPLFTADFIDARQGWVMTLSDADRLNEIYQTFDGGAHWTKVNDVAWQRAQFNFINETMGWAVVSDGSALALVRTLNGGQTWEIIKPVVIK